MPNTVRRTTGPVEAAPGSPLINLRQRRADVLKGLHLDLEVPRWTTDDFPYQVWIRYKPVNVTITLTAADKRQKAQAKDWVALAAADSLVDACIGVYLRDGEQALTLTGAGDWVTFDPDTAAEHEWVSVKGDRATELNDAFGFDATRAVETLRALFFNVDGDLLGHAERLNEFSSAVAPKADEETVGK
jgi:hypothetical protein